MIICKTESELDLMREAGRVVAETHQFIEPYIRPGITTAELDQIAGNYIRKRGARPSFKGYNGFPGNICISINEQLVHGIPSKSRVLQEGDIVTLDIGAEVGGYHGDSAWTYAVGNISAQLRKLLEVTERSLMEGLSLAKPGVRLYTISHAIQTCAEAEGFSIVREYVGHGIGAKLHEEPRIPNYGLPDRGPRLKKGMTLAIEPMVVMGERYVKTLPDNWTVVTVDGSPCAHYEHTIAITSDGYEILTQI